MISPKSRSARRRVPHDEAGQHVCRSHHRIGADRPPDRGRGQGSRHCPCVDAPVTGAQVGAENGTLTLMCGGRARRVRGGAAADAGLCAAHRPCRRIGRGPDRQDGQPDLHRRRHRGVAEALRFAQAARLDLDKVFEAISARRRAKLAADNRWQTMAQDSFDFGFAVDWMRKDLGLRSTRRAPTARRCRSPRWSISSMPSPGDGRRAAGYLSARPAAAGR